MTVCKHSLSRLLCAGYAVLVAGFAQAQGVLVAAASDLQFALEAVKDSYQASSANAVQIVYGSSGNFYRQISEGAPFELFLSADEHYITQLAQAGLTQDDGVLYAEGRLVLMTPPTSPVQADAGLESLADALAKGQIQRFAIANPEHAPYGRRAEEALRHVQLWDALQDKLVLGENVSQAAQFATSGTTQGGIIAYSLALSPNVAARGTYALIPADWHSPLKQRMVLLSNASEEAKAFYAYLQEPAARQILEQYGFTLPDSP